MARESGSSGHVYLDVLDRVLDKGIVIDAAVRISLAGVQLLGVDARVVVASIETYLRHADTLAYTDLAAAPRSTPPPPLYAEPVEPGTGVLAAGQTGADASSAPSAAMSSAMPALDAGLADTPADAEAVRPPSNPPDPAEPVEEG